MPTDRKRRHSFTRSGSGSPPPEALISNVTNSRDPKLLNARVFIGGLPSEVITKPEVEERFGQYGRVLGISIHRKFGFVQFENETDGRAACTGENLTFWHGVKLDVHMAADGMRRGGGMDRRSPGLARDMRGGPPPPRMSRDRSPPFRRPGPPEQFDREPPRWEREDNFRRDEPRAYYRDDSFRDREMFRERDREREEPYGRNRRPPPSEPYHDRRGNGREEPYRREPYPEREREREREREPYHEPYPRERPTPPPPPPPPPPSNPIECEIVVMSRTIREYGEYIDKRLRELGLSTGILFLAEEASLQQALDDITRRHCLYAVVTNVQNEAHRSMTLNILHGTPQGDAVPC